MYNNYGYNPQANLDQINRQIADLERMRGQLTQNHTPAINQTFQITPNNTTMKYANSIEDVNKELVIADTSFFNKDFTLLWIKNAKGDVRSFELKEIVPKDEKDLKIEELENQIKKLKEANYEKSNNNYVDESIDECESTDVSVHRTSKKK